MRKHLGLSALIALVLVSGIWMVGEKGGEGSKPDVILITVEETRAGHLGPCYGYKRNTTPAICELAEDGALYRNAYTQGWFTLPSLSALHTSRNHDTLNVLDLEQEEAKPLGQERKTMAEVLKENGYETHAIVYPIKYVREKYGFTQGFDTYNTTTELSSFKRLDLSGRGPQFYWLHMGWTHCSSLDPPKRFDLWSSRKTGMETYSCSSTNLTRSRLNFTIDKYDGELRRTDAYISGLVSNLKETGNYRDSLMIVTADHGTNLGEHGRVGHGISDTGLPMFPSETLTNVPLIVKPPTSSPPLDSREMVSNLDIMPTVLDAVGLPYRGVGESLFDTGKSREAVYYPLFSAIRTQDYFYMEKPLLFINRSKSPLETENHSLSPELRDRLSLRLSRWQEEERTTDRNEQLKRILKEMAYFQ